MIVVLSMMCLSALTFYEQDIDQCEGKSYTYDYWQWTHRSADLDGDGHQDLLFPTHVCFQRNGVFPIEAHAPVPGTKERALVDFFGGVLYVRFKDQLALYQWENNECRELHKQAIQWPAPAPDDSSYRGEKAEMVLFDRFLCELDDDGIPEIVLPGINGLHVYRRQGKDYVEVGLLDVLPPLKMSAGGALWPPERRRIELPYRGNYCSYVLDGNRLAVISDKYVSVNSNQYNIKWYRIECLPELKAILEEGGEENSEPLPTLWVEEHYGKNYKTFSAMHLNDTPPMDYVRTVSMISYTSAFPIPIFEITVSTNGGKSFRTIRTQDDRRHDNYVQTFVDVNHDGRTDIVCWTSDLFDGGVRETVNRFLSDTKVQREVQVYFQNAQNDFPTHPDVRGRFNIKMPKPIVVGGFLPTGDLTGDFNADGWNDVIIEHKPDELGIYLYANGAFSDKPDYVVKIPEYASFLLDDLNNDGRSDILLRGHTKEEDSYKHFRKVFLTREVSP